MLTQRWRNGMDSYRRSGDEIRTAEYSVESIPDDTTARAFVCHHHYSGSYPAARWRFGLYKAGNLAGVAVFSVPVNNKTITKTFSIADHRDGVELGRFVLLDTVPYNGESWFLGRCFHLLRPEGLAGVVSFSDPSRRVNRAGMQVFGGHIGTIYQAFNGRYIGRGTSRILKILPNGQVLNSRTMQKIRSNDQGVEYAIKLLCQQGMETPLSREPAQLAIWLRKAIDKVCHSMRHKGNHKYVWGLNKKTNLPPALPYPKQKDMA